MAKPRTKSTTARLTSLIAALGLSVHASALVVQDDGPDQEPDIRLHAFQIYNTQAARALVESATEHIEAERWSEALVDLQALLEEHRGEVLGASRPRTSGSGEPSKHDVHDGAAEWAARALSALDTKGKELYEKRYGDRARRALGAAIATGDRAALIAVARRWPISQYGIRAWWALGDLELEMGNVDAAVATWSRALARGVGDLDLVLDAPEDWIAALERLGAAGEPPTGIRARVEFAISLEDDGRSELGLVAPTSFGSALVGGGDYGRTGRAQDTWPRQHTLTGNGHEHPFKRTLGKYSLYPVRLDDVIYYSTSRSLHAVGAFTGEEIWRSPAQRLRWNDVPWDALRFFEEAVAFGESLIAPAAAQGVVVAPLQIPLVFEDKDSYGDLDIIKIVPERRLFAFDARTGEPLWDTHPPLTWDGESGTFSERMTIVGPPTVAGSRVLVPTAMLRGRIELHVGCFDLHTGELLWNAPLVTGQVPLNMFGRLVKEYTAPPVAVSGDRVVVLTQLGTLACLDLFTGETLWQTLYDQIQITPGNYYADGELHSVWGNAPPFIADDVVVAAPRDGRDLMGVDLSTGSVIWTISSHTLNRRVGDNTSVSILVGASDKRVFLSGLKVAAFEAPGGLAREAPARRAWVFPAREALGPRLPRPVLTADRVYVPSRTELIVIDRRNGKQLERIPTNGRTGNLLIGEGMLFTLSVYNLNGFFEWDTLVRRARTRVAEAPTDPRAANTLALLLYKRGISAIQEGDYKGASRFLSDAREELERVAGSEMTSAPAQLRESLHLVLRAEARNMRLAADPRGALRRLQQARPLGPTREARRDTLLEEQAILRGRSLEDWLEVLTILERDYGDLTVTVVAEHVDPDAGWNGHLSPRVASMAEGSSTENDTTLSVGLWVLVERSQAWAERGNAGDDAREFADLHEILHRYRREPLLEGAAYDWAAARVGAKLARGERAGYAAFEERAQALLDQAQSQGDLDLLEQIPRLFPHSTAAGTSNDARIELSLSKGDAERVADIVLGELSESWEPEHATEREVQHLLRLAGALGKRGNLELRAALTERLAAYHPNVVPLLEEAGGARLPELARSWAIEPAPPSAASSATFGHELQTAHDTQSGAPFLPVGEVPPGPGQDGHVLLFCDGSRLYAISDESGPEELWRYFFDNPNLRTRSPDSLPTDFEIAIATSRGRVHVSTLSSVLTLDRDTDEALWNWSSGGQGLVSVQACDGVVVVREDAGIERKLQTWRLIGLDAATGIVLWEFSFLDERFHPRPVLGEGALILMPATAGAAQIFDLFTGRPTASFDLDYSSKRMASSAWIEERRVILPHYQMGLRPQRNHIQAFDLDDGHRAWRVPLAGGPDGDRELSEIFSFEGRHFVCLYPVKKPGRREDPRRPGLYELNSKLGALANQPVVELRADGDDWIGIEARDRTILDTPFLFVREAPKSQDERFWIRAIHVRYGQRWRSPMPRTFLGSASNRQPPAVSDSTVVLAYKELLDKPNSRGRRTRLMFLDRAGGRELGVQTLPEPMWSTTAGVRFSPLGDALIVSGAKQMDFMR